MSPQLQVNWLPCPSPSYFLKDIFFHFPDPEDPPPLNGNSIPNLGHFNFTTIDNYLNFELLSRGTDPGQPIFSIYFRYLVYICASVYSI